MLQRIVLFDRERDPYETHNFAGDPEYADIEEELRAGISDWESRTPSAKS